MKSEALAIEKTRNLFTEKHSLIVLFGVLIITALVFSGCLKLGWTNWDDDLYIYNNRLVKEGTLKEIITPPADPARYNVYNPLVISSFALEWKLVQDKPFLYHFNNLLLHLICTALVFLLFHLMGLSLWWSGFAALLFGIHPMRVESVAWITERKDLLYALFYLAALLAYIRYLASNKALTLLLVFVFFILSLYSKIQAISLPFVLILIDWYLDRKIGWKVIAEKLFFFAGALFIGVSFSVGVNFVLRKADGIDFNKVLIFLKQIILSAYAYAIYILKLLVPYVTSPLYPPPVLIGAQHWVGAVISLAILLGALAVRRKYRFVTCGILFFTFNIFLLPFASAVGDTTFLNDRYTYVAYIGLFFILAMSLQQFLEKYPRLRIPIAGIAVSSLVVFGAITIKYIPVWENSATLWTHVIKKYPRRIPVAYLNRGHYWYKNNERARALEDFSTAIEIHPDYLPAYTNRGLIYLEENDTAHALEDYNRILALMSPYDASGRVLNPPVSDALGNRGLIYFKRGQYHQAVSDLDLAILLNPPNPTNYLNRASVYLKLGRMAEAGRDALTAEDLGAVIDPSLRK